MKSIKFIRLFNFSEGIILLQLRNLLCFAKIFILVYYSA